MSMSTDFQKLSEDELQKAVSGLAGWRLKDGKLQKEFEFKSFMAAFGFISQVALQAHRINHHPDLFSSFKQVNISLWTHSAGEATSKDIELAQAIDRI